MRIAAIVLAAGEGRRMGGPKALLSLGGRTFLERAVALFDRSDVDERIAVLGAQAARVREGVELPPGTTVVTNPSWSAGMLSSVWTGLDAAESRGVDAVLLHPVDNPLVTPATVGSVIAALREGARIVVPSHGGRRGHPAGFAREARAALRHAPLAGGARVMLAEHADWVVHVPAGPDCLFDIDTPDDLEAAQRRLASDGR